MKDQTRSAYWTYPLLLTLVAVYAEFVRSHREVYWRGLNLELTVGAFAGAAIYFVFFAVTFALIRVILNKGSKDRIPSIIVNSIAGALPAALLCGSYLLLWDKTQPRFVVVMAILDAMMLTILAIASFLSPERRRRLTAAPALALFTAILAIVAVAYFEFYDFEARHQSVTRIPFAWIVGSMGVLCLAAIVPQGKARLFPVAALLALAVWPAYYAILSPHQWSNATKTDQPNLLLITIDTLRSDFTSPYGGDVPMPALQQLADEGVLFEKSYSSAPWTVPAMNSLFGSRPATSLTPGLELDEWLAEIRRYELNGTPPLLAELLRDKGYATAGFTGNQLLKNKNGIMRGFQTTRFMPHSDAEIRSPFRMLPYLQDVAAAMGWLLPRPQDTTETMKRFGEEFLHRQGGDPWFLWIHFMDPHSPYDPPDRLRTQEGPWRIWAPLRPSWGDVGSKHPEVKMTKDMFFSANDVEYIRSLYKAEMRYADEAVGHVLDTVRAMGAWDNTVVCLTADHGEEFLDHDSWLHGRTLYDEMTRIPLIVRAPGVASDRLQPAISSIDVMPTLADLMGVNIPTEWHGKSWAPTLRDPAVAPPVRPIFLQGTSNTQLTPLQAVVEDDDKLIQKVDASPAEETLYILADDPLETKNVAEEMPDRVTALQQLIKDIEQTFPARFAPLETETTQQQKDDMKESLDALGYL